MLKDFLYLVAFARLRGTNQQRGLVKQAEVVVQQLARIDVHGVNAELIEEVSGRKGDEERTAHAREYHATDGTLCDGLLDFRQQGHAFCARIERNDVPDGGGLLHYLCEKLILCHIHNVFGLGL